MGSNILDTDTELGLQRRRLEDLLDRDEIATLVHRLGTALDEGRFDDFRSIFAEEATAKTPGGVAEGLDAMIAQASRNHSPDNRIQHRISDVLVDLDADKASVRANLAVTFAKPDDAPGEHFWMGEVYRFTATRAPHGWRLTSVETTPVWAHGTRPV